MTAIRALVPMAHVASVPRSIAFYQQLGFETGNTFTPEGANEPSWAWLETSNAQLMVTRAVGPVDAHAVLFYIYCEDVAAKHAELTGKGIAAGSITTEFYAPRGEFKVVDPDGYVLMFTHT